MAFDDLIAKINLFLSDVGNHPKDAHEQLEELHFELNQLRATGQPIPDDLARLEKMLEEQFSSPINQEIIAQGDSGEDKGS